MKSSVPISVMIVDDQSDVRFLVRLVLEECADFAVVGEADGFESLLASIDEADPDVVVMDARMPRVDGFEAAPLILDRRPDQAIVLLTGLADDDVRSRASAVGIAEVVSKDDFDALPGVLRRLAPVR